MTNEEGLVSKKTTVEEVSQNCRNPGKKARVLYFYLLFPIVFVALFMEGAGWIITYPDFEVHFYLLEHTYYALVYCFPIYILYFLLLLPRCYFGKPLSGKNEIVSFVAIFSIWACFDALYFNENGFLRPMLRLGGNSEPIVYVFIFLIAVTLLKACFVILGYDKSKRSAKNDLISCTILFVTYFVIFTFIKEGGLIYFLPSK